MDIKIVALFGSLIILTACNNGSNGGDFNPLVEPQDNAPAADAPANDNTTPPAGDESPTEEGSTSDDETVTNEMEEDEAVTENPDTGTGNGTGDETDSDPGVTPTTTGQPVAGGPTDCANTLPCSALTDDSGLIFTLSFADGVETDGDGNLRLDFSVEATREAVVEIDRSSNVLAGGKRLTDGRITFGENTASYTDVVTTETPVGIPVNAAIEFSDRLGSGVDQLDRVEIRLTDSDISKILQFSAVPTGRAPSETADCIMTLPCTWTTLAGDVEIILSSVGNHGYSDRLAVAYTVVNKTQRKVSVAVGFNSHGLTDQGAAPLSSAISLGGERFTYGTYATHLLEAGQTIAGAAEFDRAASDLESQISQLQLNVFEERPLRIPYWNPVFVNVPIQ